MNFRKEERKRHLGILALIRLTTCTIRTRALENGIGRTPAMGFNTWNRFHCDIDEMLVKEAAQAMVEKGLKDVGYRYINVDDCWMSDTRTPEGYIQEDLTRFPSGLKALGDYLHSLGLRFGIYSSAGYKTCQGLPASLDHETEDAQTWASWGVDYLKYDNCGNNGSPPENRYRTMNKALNGTYPPMLFSACEWGVDNPAAWMGDVANSWRTTYDVMDTWESMINITDINTKKWRYAKAGAFNDPDMLEVGNGGMTMEEYQTHFSLWAIMKAPLLIGCDVRYIDNAALALLKNEEVIAVNQDPLAIQARRVWSSESPESNGTTAVIVVPCKSNQGNFVPPDEVHWTYDDKKDIDGTSIRLPSNTIFDANGDLISTDRCLRVTISTGVPVDSMDITHGTATASTPDVLIASCEEEGEDNNFWRIKDAAVGSKAKKEERNQATISPISHADYCLSVNNQQDGHLGDMGVQVLLSPCIPTKTWQLTTFLIIWSMLILIVTTVWGTFVFARPQTSLALGIFIGLTALLSQIQLILFAYFQELANQSLVTDEKLALKLFAAFALTFALVYSVFSIMLFSHGRSFLEDQKQEQQQARGEGGAGGGGEKVGARGGRSQRSRRREEGGEGVIENGAGGSILSKAFFHLA